MKQLIVLLYNKMIRNVLDLFGNKKKYLTKT